MPTETEIIPQSPMERAFASLKESINLVGDRSRGSRAKNDTLLFAAWVSTDLVANSKVFDEACRTHLTSEQLEDSYSKTLRSNLKAVLFSTKAEVKAIVEQYGRGQYIVGISRAAEIARGTKSQTEKRKAAAAEKAPAAGTEQDSVADSTPSPVQQIESLLERVTTLADLRIIAEKVQERIRAISSPEARAA